MTHPLLSRIPHGQNLLIISQKNQVLNLVEPILLHKHHQCTFTFVLCWDFYPCRKYQVTNCPQKRSLSMNLGDMGIFYLFRYYSPSGMTSQISWHFFQLSPWKHALPNIPYLYSSWHWFRKKVRLRVVGCFNPSSGEMYCATCSAPVV